MTTFILPESIPHESAEKPSLYGTFSKCLKLYKTLVHAAVEEGSSSAVIYSRLGGDRLLDEFGRLKIWGDQTKASLQPRSRGSLDDFLRNEERLGTEVQEILLQLERQLKLAVSLAHGTHGDDDPSSQNTDYSDGSVTDSDYSSDSASERSGDIGSSRKVPKLAVVASHIFELIQLLYHFGALLRRPGLKGRFLRHSTSEESTIAETFEIRHIEEKLRHWEWQAQQTSGEPLTSPSDESVTPEEIVKRLASKSPTDPHLILSRRFAKANSQRREQLRYWYKHPYLPQPAQETVDLEIKGKGKSALRNTGEIQTTETQSQSQKPRSESSKPTVHSFSTIAKSAIHDGGTETGRPRTVYAESVVAGKWTTRVPPPPISKSKANDEDEFECPYCCMRLNVDLMQDRQAWKRHVFRDLRPYTCTFTSCTDPNKLYSTRHDWVYHEMQMHWRQWVCHVCDCPFDTQSLLVTHLNDTHPGTWTSRQLSAILEMSDRPINESLILPCKLCKSELSISKLLDHTAAHLEEISLFVLPIHSEEEDEGNSNHVAGIGTEDAGTQGKSSNSTLHFSDRADSHGEVLPPHWMDSELRSQGLDEGESEFVKQAKLNRAMESPRPFDPNEPAKVAQWATQANELKEENTDPDIDDIIDLFIEPRGKPPGTKVEVTRNLVIYLCKKARDIFFDQPILLELMAPLKVCGDIYGQHYQLLRMFESNGFPPEANYLFLGNYVGKGRQSIETICTLLAYKIKYPENFFLLRGNQESLLVSSVASFYQECGSRYGLEVASLFEDCFNCMPVASIIGDKIFAVHGGLSPQLDSFEQIRRIRRPATVPRDGLLHDLLWAYPEAAMRGWSGRHSEFSLAFGPNVVESFLEKHGLDLVCRSGQFIQEGYEFFAGRKLVTLFTTPNYLGKHDNSGAVMCVDEDLLYTFQINRPVKTQVTNLWYDETPKGEP